MTLEENLTAVLRTICPRTYSDFARTDTELPYVTHQQVGGQSLSFIDKTVPNKENADFQINVWSAKRTEATAMMKQIEAALIVATEFQASPIAARASDFDADMERYCARQDFTIWADR